MLTERQEQPPASCRHHCHGGPSGSFLAWAPITRANHPRMNTSLAPMSTSRSPAPYSAAPYRIDLPKEALARAFHATPEHPVLDLHGGVAPGRPAWVIRLRAGRRVITPMVWGFPPPPGREQLVANARNLDSTFWRPWLKRPNRCLIPFTSFSAPAGPSGALQPANQKVAAFAGLWRSFEEVLFFARLTSPDDGSGWAATMPVVLTEESEFANWLAAAPDAALQMQRPPARQKLTVLASAG